MDANGQNAESQLEAALEHLKSAIELLDRAGAPGHIAAHADLAASQLADTLQSSKPMIKRRLHVDDEDRGTVSTFWRHRRG